LGKYEDAVRYLKKSLEANPKNTVVLAGLACCYVALEREGEARSIAAEILKLNPKFSVRKWLERYPPRDQALKERMHAALLKVGLPE
jgi:tetratricopeptide (TPR) repeat protein